MLWCSLLLPDLPLEVYARAWGGGGAARPFAVASGGSRPAIVAANDAARVAGVKRGQPVAAALALVPALVLRDRDQRAEREALEAIATYALSFTSTASLAPPRALVAEIGGSLRLFGGPGRLVATIAGDPDPAKEHTVKTLLVIRNSCCCTPATMVRSSEVHR